MGDATVYDESLRDLADVVIADVPCSGLGVIRRKPEIKYKKKAETEGLPEIQRAILGNAARYVKAGGRLVYSTCTLNRSENEDVAEAFASENAEFTLVEMKTYFPDEQGGDGFFTALFERKA